MSNNEHDAFKEQRKSALYWLNKSTEELALLDKLEDVLPSFVRRRYRIGSLSTGRLSLSPSGPTTDDPEEADKLHADVNKLFVFLLGKCEGIANQEPPSRSLEEWRGCIRYDFTLEGLPGFEDGLVISIEHLPAGSACHITKRVTGTRVVEEVEYEMVCED
jgi:hypothetical protein